MKKKIVLLGDSIRLIGYGTLLPELIEDDFDVWQPEENSMYVQHVLRQLFNFRNKIDEADIIHFNSGEWDVCNLFGDGTFNSLDEYSRQLGRIADVLLKKGKTVVFATTTPVRDANWHNSNSDIREFNEAALRVLKPKGIIINDLYSVVAEDINGNISEKDNIHLTEKGIKLCARATAKILENLK